MLQRKMFSVIIKTNGKTPWMEEKHSETSVIKGTDFETVIPMFERRNQIVSFVYCRETTVAKKRVRTRTCTHKHTQSDENTLFMFQREWQK